MDNKYKIQSALFGVAVGDALGVPVEFCSREELRQNPVTEMTGGEDTAHGQPAGTWSDDSSLTFCLAEALTQQYSLDIIAVNFMKWIAGTMWTPWGEVFDIGNGTYSAISRIVEGVKPELAGGDDENSNGNGSLMRILPLVFYLCNTPIEKRFEITRQVSSITHKHIRSVVACFYYLELARNLLVHKLYDKKQAYQRMLVNVRIFFLYDKEIESKEFNLFNNQLRRKIFERTEDTIRSSGYVVDTLIASIWCFLTTDSYKDCVLKAVNLGGDTDTTAAVAGGLAGLFYGFDSIPKEWLSQIARYDDIMDLCERLSEKCKI